MAKNVETKSEWKDEMDKFYEELTAWAEKHKERGVILLTVNENNIFDNVVFGRRGNLIKAMAAGMLNMDSNLAYIIHEASGILKEDLTKRLKKAFELGNDVNEYEEAEKELMDRIGRKVDVKS